MAIAAQRRTGESNEKLISRWKKKSQATGLVQHVRKRLRYSKKKNKTKLKETAIVREGYRAEKKRNLFYS